VYLVWELWLCVCTCVQLEVWKLNMCVLIEVRNHCVKFCLVNWKNSAEKTICSRQKGTKKKRQTKLFAPKKNKEDWTNNINNTNEFARKKCRQNCMIEIEWFWRSEIEHENTFADRMIWRLKNRTRNYICWPE
jgi:hypothetical protein